MERILGKICYILLINIGKISLAKELYAFQIKLLKHSDQKYDNEKCTHCTQQIPSNLAFGLLIELLITNRIKSSKHNYQIIKTLKEKCERKE